MRLYEERNILFYFYGFIYFGFELLRNENEWIWISDDSTIYDDDARTKELMRHRYIRRLYQITRKRGEQETRRTTGRGGGHRNWNRLKDSAILGKRKFRSRPEEVSREKIYSWKATNK